MTDDAVKSKKKSEDKKVLKVRQIMKRLNLKKR